MKINFITPRFSNYNFNYAPNNKQKTPAFSGATEVFARKFVETQKEIEDVFIKNPENDWIAGTLPPHWLEKLQGKSQAEKAEIVKKVLHAFRAAVKHLKPYNAPQTSKKKKKNGTNKENRHIKEASKYLTKALRHFGIIPETNSVNFKRRKVFGKYINRGYVLKEKGQNPTLERLFIKTFKKTNPDVLDSNYNGVKAETAHWLNINEINCKYISKIYWGDIKGNYMASEYATPPKYISPIVHFKPSYKTLQDFYYDFQRQTGIEVMDLIDRNIQPGSTNAKGVYVPRSKEEIIIEYLQSELQKSGLTHYDLHKDNAVIGTDEKGKAIVKIIDIGGVAKKY